MGILDQVDRLLGAADPLLEAWEKPLPRERVLDLADQLQTARLTGKLLGKGADYSSLSDPALRRAAPYLNSKRYHETDRGEFERMSRSILRMDADVSAGRMPDEPGAIVDRLILEEKMSYLAEAATPKTQRGDFLDLLPTVDADRTQRLAVAIGSMPLKARHALSQGRMEGVPRRELRLMTETASPAREQSHESGILSKARAAIAPGRSSDRASGMDPRLVDAFRRYDGAMRDQNATFAPWAEGAPGSKDRTRWIRSSFEEATRPLFATDGPNPRLTAAIDAKALSVIGGNRPISEELEDKRSSIAGDVAHFIGRDPEAFSASISREARGLAVYGDDMLVERFSAYVHSDHSNLPPRSPNDGDVARSTIIAGWMRQESIAASQGLMDPEELVKKSIDLVRRAGEKIAPADPAKVAASVPIARAESVSPVSTAKGPGGDGDIALMHVASRDSGR